MLIWPMMAVGWVVNLLQRGHGQHGPARRRSSPPRPMSVDGDEPAAPGPAIEVDESQLHLPGDRDAEVLQNVSFSLAAGGTLGIVGRTGSGKTTLVELLMRLYDPPGEPSSSAAPMRDLSLDASGASSATSRRRPSSSP